MAHVSNYRKLPRAIEVAKFIIEGHTTMEAADEFGLSKTGIQNDLNLIISVAFSDDDEELKKLYLRAKKTLKELAKKNHGNNFARYNATRKKSNPE